MTDGDVRCKSGAECVRYSQGRVGTIASAFRVGGAPGIFKPIHQKQFDTRGTTQVKDRNTHLGGTNKQKGEGEGMHNHQKVAGETRKNSNGNADMAEFPGVSECGSQ